MATIHNIYALLASVGVAPIYLEPIPATADPAIRINGPYMSEPVGDFTLIQRKRYQIYTRGTDQWSVEELANACYKALADAYPGGNEQTSEVEVLQAPSLMGTDDNGRFEYVFNISVAVWPKGD